MTVLLIDGVGHKREMEIPKLLTEIRVHVREPYSVRRADPPRLPNFGKIARFQLTSEPSYPPVYRQVLD